MTENKHYDRIDFIFFVQVKKSVNYQKITAKNKLRA